MVRTITPFSTRAKEGATDSPLGDFVSVDQQITSTADVGFYDSKTGKLTGVIASEEVFGTIQTDTEVANGGYILTPSVNPNGTWPLDMTGYDNLFIAIKPTNGGNYKVEAVMGPDSLTFGGLSPVDAATLLYGNIYNKQEFQKLFGDNAQALVVDVWNIFYLEQVLQNQKLLQFKITNNSGDISTIDTAFMRLV